MAGYGGKLRYLIFLPFDVTSRARPREKYTIHFRVIISHMATYVCANNFRFRQIGNRVASFRYINARNDYFSAFSLRRS